MRAPSFLECAQNVFPVWNQNDTWPNSLPVWVLSEWHCKNVWALCAASFRFVEFCGFIARRSVQACFWQVSRFRQFSSATRQKWLAHSLVSLSPSLPVFRGLRFSYKKWSASVRPMCNWNNIWGIVPDSIFEIHKKALDFRVGCKFESNFYDFRKSP